MADVVATTSRYHYLPSSGIAITFISLYSVSGALHLGEALYGRLYWLLPTVVLGLVGEIVGWACRYWSTFSAGLARAPYIAQFVAIILAPTFLLAGYFVLLGRIIQLLGQEYSRLKHNRYVLLFCISDLVSLIIQGIGGGMAAGSSDPAKARTGGHVALAGIAFQLASIVIYILLLSEFFLRFHFDIPLTGTSGLNAQNMKVRIEDGYPFAAIYTGNPSLVRSQGLERRKLAALDWKFQLLLVGGGISVLCILIRASYRVAELSGGFNSPVADNQLLFDVLDGSMIVIANYMLNIFHPAFLLRNGPPAGSLSSPSEERDVESVNAGGADADANGLKNGLKNGQTSASSEEGSVVEKR